MKKIWFNHWFSTAYHIIDLIKNDPLNDYKIIVSNDNKDSVTKLVADEFFVEPKFTDSQDYINFCLEFCKKNKINLFVPRRNKLEICEKIECFNELGVKVLTDPNYELMHSLYNKELTYKLIKNINSSIIPEFFVVKTVPEFETAYHKLIKNNKRVCIKPVLDEGATGFRIIDNSITLDENTFNQSIYKITYEKAIKIIEKKLLNEIIVMPYLDGVEISVDCLKTLTGTIIIPRYKLGGRITEVRFEQDIINICEEIIERLDIKTPLNIQFKCKNNEPYLLEINARMSGGIQLSVLASGINIPSIAMAQMFDNHRDWTIDKKIKRLTYIEMPFIIQEGDIS